MTAAFIQRLTLTNFRSYHAAQISLDRAGPVVLTGANGAGAVSAEIQGMLGLATLGTGIDPPAGEESAPARNCRVDREDVGSAAAFADHLRVVWLTPAKDPLFNGPASQRRRFLDRLVLAVDAPHSRLIAAL